MPRKVSDEQRVSEYFLTAKLEKAEVMLELAKATLKKRQKEAKLQEQESVENLEAMARN